MAKRIGRVVLGLTPDDLEKLNLDNIDIIAALGKWNEWSKDQVRYICCYVFLVRISFLINAYRNLVKPSIHE